MEINLCVFVSGPSACSGWVVEEAGGAGEKSSRAGPSGEGATVPRGSRSVSPPLLALSSCVLSLANNFLASWFHAGRKNNWPPLPEKFPVGPCFYHDISVDIPVEFQKTVKIMYNLWMCKQMWPHTQRGEKRLWFYCFTLSSVVSLVHAGTLFVNMFGCLAWVCVDSSHGVDFGLAMLWFLLFTPCSFVCWYRPLYGAFRWAVIYKDNLQNYFLASVPVSLPSSPSPLQERQFFPLLRLLLCLYLSIWRSRPANNRHQRLGNLVTVFLLLLTSASTHVSRSPTHSVPVVCLASGWIASLTGLNASIPVGIIMLLIAALFTALSVCSLIMFKKVSRQAFHLWFVQHPRGQMKLAAMTVKFVIFHRRWYKNIGLADRFSLCSLQVHALYRTTGASFEKAQQEFATGVMSNKTVQTAAANAAANAASNAARGTFRP